MGREAAALKTIHASADRRRLHWKLVLWYHVFFASSVRSLVAISPGNECLGFTLQCGNYANVAAKSLIPVATGISEEPKMEMEQWDDRLPPCRQFFVWQTAAVCICKFC